MGVSRQAPTVWRTTYTVETPNMSSESNTLAVQLLRIETAVTTRSRLTLMFPVE